jgi:hypothetical protein
LGSAKNLTETQDVFNLRLSLRQGTGQNITVSRTSVSSLHKDKGGAVTKVQVNGGMHPGNSGGPVHRPSVVRHNRRMTPLNVIAAALDR